MAGQGDVRNARLRECVDVIRALLAGEVVDHHGLVTVDRARLWTLPAEPPPLIGAAVSAETAGWAAEWADGLVTINQPREQLERVLAAFREGGGEGKPAFLQVHLSWAPSEQEALDIAYDQWRTNVFPPPIPWDLAHRRGVRRGRALRAPEDVRSGVLVSADLGRHAAWLQDLGRARLRRDLPAPRGPGARRPFIDAFGEQVLPELR